MIEDRDRSVRSDRTPTLLTTAIVSSPPRYPNYLSLSGRAANAKRRERSATKQLLAFDPVFITAGRQTPHGAGRTARTHREAARVGKPLGAARGGPGLLGSVLVPVEGTRSVDSSVRRRLRLRPVAVGDDVRCVVATPLLVY
jgi:hypothetical protein